MSKTKDISIVGAGGHTRSLLMLLNHCGLTASQIVDAESKKQETINDVPVRQLMEKMADDMVVVLSSGDCQRRKQLFLQYRKNVLKDNLIHPTALIERLVRLGEANQIFAKAYINSNVQIGSNNLLNTGCILEHEVILGDHNHISVGAIVGGRVKVGSGCFIGAGAVIIDKVSICDDVTIGANSTVIDSINEPGVYVGQPARKIK